MNAQTTSSAAPQPCLRSYIVYNELPAGCIAFEVPDDSSAPFLLAGEFVVIDPEDREPAEGEFFAITWKSDIRQKWRVVQMHLRAGRYGKGNMFEDGRLWFIGALAPQQMISLTGYPIGKAMRRVDGPFYDDHCREISHGKIIGIFEPDFRRQLSKAAGEDVDPSVAPLSSLPDNPYYGL